MEERISIHFYKISFLKIQILNFSLSDKNALKGQEGSNSQRSVLDGFRRDLLQWYDAWAQDGLLCMAPSSGEGPCQTSEKRFTYLQAWADMNYNATKLMLSRCSDTEVSANKEDVIDACRNIVSCCNALVKHQQRAFCTTVPNVSEGQHQIPVFPVDWTLSSLVFSAGICLSLFGKGGGQADVAVARRSWEKMVRSCLITIAMMEGDPANQSSGSSQILEALFNQDCGD